MHLLHDTHTLLWAMDETRVKLKPETTSLINNPENIVYVSIATLWGVEIKLNIRKLKLPAGFFESLPEYGYEILNISVSHIKVFKELSLLHRDPFY